MINEFKSTQDRLCIDDSTAALACDTSERTIRRWRAETDPLKMKTYAVIILENIDLFLPKEATNERA